MSLLEVVAAILLSIASVLVFWAIRLCDAEPEAPAAPASRRQVDHDPPLRHAA